jgi:aspartate kinase
MKVFKFGGASVKDAAAIQNVLSIVKQYEKEQLLIVLSAMGKTTNNLERLLQAVFNKDSEKQELEWQNFVHYHKQIITDLFEAEHGIFTYFNNFCDETALILQSLTHYEYNKAYDSLVGRGELIATKIVADFLHECEYKVEWVSALQLIQCDSTWREGNVDWNKTQEKCNKMLASTTQNYITQGFVAATEKGEMISLGREGSDYSAAILAYVLKAEEVVIWKDVPGLLNADPKYFNNVELLRNISYREAIELAYYGATIIHPKTIKPLQNKNIPLRVKSFVNPNEKGSLINNNFSEDGLIASYIFRMNQMLISISPRDFSFIVEDKLSKLFAAFAETKIKVNTMQNSALNFSVTADFDENKLKHLQSILEKEYQLKYNTKLELLTIRHYTEAIIKKLCTGRTILLVQKSRNTVRILMESL